MIAQSPEFRVQWLVKDKRWSKILPSYKKIATAALKHLPHTPHEDAGSYEISVLLTNDKEVHALNKKFRQKDKPTNVLSFPDGENGYLGDIAMSLDTLQREAKEENKPLENHFTHLLIHGVLHLMGYDHETDEEQNEMESLEIKILKKLDIPNPYK
jgi:probable rRNA maturation factor